MNPLPHFSNPEEEISFLKKEIERHNTLYYDLDQPEISDFEFDKLLERLRFLEQQHPEFATASSPTQKVGGKTLKGFLSEEHEYPMLSLDNSYSEGDLFDWDNRCKKILQTENVSYSCELKYDGASISLVYENGVLTKALTRGDGMRGDVVTDNIRTVRNLPQTIPYVPKLTVRGEVIIRKDDFLKLNEKRIEVGLEPFSNPRNTASGSLKILDVEEVKQRPLQVLIYGVAGEIPDKKTHHEILKLLSELGFDVPPHNRLCANIQEVLHFIHEWESKRWDLPYETDGIVVKVNEIEHQKTLGITAKSPRWAMAFKYKAEAACTQLLSIDYQVGRTGAITPVANLEPVHLAGTIVKRASLHNADIIRNLDLHEADFVWVEKGGEIIPKITAVEIGRRKPNAQPIRFIENCPACGTKLIRIEGEAQHFCPNEKNCPPQILGRMEHFVSRKAMNIEFLGSEILAVFYKLGWIKTIADLYELKKEQIARLERFGEKSAENIVQSLEKSKSVPYERVLFALGIRHVGETVAKKLAKAFPNIESLMAASVEELIAVEDVGEKIAQSIQRYFRDEDNLRIIQRLRQYGLQFQTMKKSTTFEGKLAGKSFLFTGTLSKFKREEAEKLVEELGGRVLSSVSKNLNYLVVGEKAGSKLQKAQQIPSIQIITEEEFMEMVKTD